MPLSHASSLQAPAFYPQGLAIRRAVSVPLLPRAVWPSPVVRATSPQLRQSKPEPTPSIQQAEPGVKRPKAEVKPLYKAT